MPEAVDPRDSGPQEVLAFILILMVAFMAMTFYTLATQDSAKPVAHPPQVSIYRTDPPQEDNAIVVRYDGGIDDVFVGNFSITANNKTEYFENPGAGKVVGYVRLNSYTCVDVKAWDRAVRVFRPIGSRCL